MDDLTEDDEEELEREWEESEQREREDNELRKSANPDLYEAYLKGQEERVERGRRWDRWLFSQGREMTEAERKVYESGGDPPVILPPRAVETLRATYRTVIVNGKKKVIIERILDPERD